MKKFIYILLLLPVGVFSQEKKEKTNYYGLMVSGGKIIVHTNKIYATAPPMSNSIEAAIRFPSLGNKHWHYARHFPTVSLNVAYNYYQSNLLGSAIGFYPSIEHTLFTQKSMKGFVEFGGGIGYATKHWRRNPISDTMNNIIGSALNNFSSLRFGIEKKINAKLDIKAGIAFNHVSNGAMRSPNYGINYASIFAGVNFKPKTYEIENWDTSYIEILIKIKPKKNITAKIAYSMAENTKAYNGPMYSIYHAALLASKDIHKKNRVYIGLEATYFAMLESIFVQTERYVGKERATAIRMSAVVGNEFLYGKIGLPVQAGFYFSRPNGGPRWYQQLGINYHFYHTQNKGKWLKDVFLSTSLKTHIVNAESGYLGLGFIF